MESTSSLRLCKYLGMGVIFHLTAQTMRDVGVCN